METVPGLKVTTLCPVASERAGIRAGFDRQNVESDRKGQGGKGGEEGPGMGKLSVFSENRSWNTVSSSSSKPVAALDKANFFKKQKLYILKMYNTII